MLSVVCLFCVFSLCRGREINAKQIGYILKGVGERWRVRSEFFPFYLLSTFLCTRALTLPLDSSDSFSPFFRQIKCVPLPIIYLTHNSNRGNGRGILKFSLHPSVIHFWICFRSFFSFQLLMEFLLVSVTNSKISLLYAFIVILNLILPPQTFFHFDCLMKFNFNIFFFPLTLATFCVHFIPI